MDLTLVSCFFIALSIFQRELVVIRLVDNPVRLPK